mgnify:FL=1
MEKRRSASQPEAVWKEKDLVSGREEDAMVAIFRTSGCSWAKKGGCTMCGYSSASLSEVTSEDLMSQIDAVMERYEGEKFVKLYTSGSFLDDGEIPPEVRERIFREFSGCSRILFESRPEYVTRETLSRVPKTVTLALGLESSDPEVLSKSVRKGFTPDDSRRAGECAKELGLSVRTYLLLKPPFMIESEAIEDALRSIAFADAFSDEISINPVNVQRGTYLEHLWRRGGYRSPWIWSLVYVIARAAPITKARIMSSPSGGGTQRGVHNCGVCDRKVLDTIHKFSITQDLGCMDAHCECEERWRRYLESERVLGTAADIDRGIKDELMLVGR